ncbi:hypothetical protein PY093_01840 [Cytobacillus sp. S13-E01]|uniref:hypothetical protein n=1 Tax=Cytobacillus sp. S13-E01 TaxID=3031326 RepID=UPI0023D83325|nr:hypothetical protein [Cytobacillus sp. S13-E01]MDF0725451.1 hypothetical protein [Cytobacillus sp. S13-E01]
MLLINLSLKVQSSTLEDRILKLEFTNASEPDYCRDFRILAKYDTNSERWACDQFCVYNKREDRFEDVLSMFTDEYTNWIIAQIITRESNQLTLSESTAEAM